MRLADLTEMRSGRTPALVRATTPEVARAVAIAEGDLIVGARGAETAVCLASPDIFGAFVSLDLYLVRPNPKFVHPEYLWAYLRLPDTQTLLAGGKQGTGLARLPKETLETLPVRMPPLARQKLVADLALSFESERDLLRRLAVLNEELRLEVLGRAVNDAESESSRRSL